MLAFKRAHGWIATLALMTAGLWACSEQGVLEPPQSGSEIADAKGGNGKGKGGGGGGDGGGDDSGGGLSDASLAFQTSARSSSNLLIANADGSGASELLSIKFGFSLQYSFDPNANAIVYSHIGALERLEYSITDGILSLDRAVPLGDCWIPSYSPDGESIACRERDENDDHQIRIINPDGTGIQPIYTALSTNFVRSVRWDRSGSAVYFVEDDASDHGSILRVALDAAGDPIPTEVVFSDPAIDVRHVDAAKTSDLLAFSTEDERIYVLDPATDGLSELTTGSDPVFSSDDGEIYYTAGGNKLEIRRISVQGGPSSAVVKGARAELRR